MPCQSPGKAFDIIRRRLTSQGFRKENMFQKRSIRWRYAMKTFMANPAKIDRKWYVVDAEGQTLGHLASEVA